MPGYGNEAEKIAKSGISSPGTLSTALKIASWIAIAHLYMILCAIVYQSLETNALDEQSDLVAEYLIRAFQHGDIATLQNRNSGLFSQFMVDLRRVANEQTERNRRHDFRSLAKSYTFVLTVHSTVGNSGLTITAWQSKLFFVFTAPIGVLFYYLMLHFISVEFVRVLRAASVSFLPYARRGWSEQQRMLFGRFKILILPFLLSGLLILLLATIALAVGETYLSGLHLMVDTYLTSGTSSYLNSLSSWNDSVAAVAGTLYVFIVLVFFYTTMFATFNTLWGHTSMEIWSIICTGSDVGSGYYSLPQDDEPSSECPRKTAKFLYESGLYGDPIRVKDKCNQTALFSVSSSEVRSASSRGRASKAAKSGGGILSDGSSRELTPFESSVEASDLEIEPPTRASKARPTPSPLDMGELSRRLREQEDMPKIRVTLPTPVSERAPTTLFPSKKAERNDALVEMEEVEAPTSVFSVDTCLTSSGPPQASPAPVIRPREEPLPPFAISPTAGALEASDVMPDSRLSQSTLVSPAAQSLSGVPADKAAAFLDEYDDISSEAESMPSKEKAALAGQTLKPSDSEAGLRSGYSDISLSEITGL